MTLGEKTRINKKYFKKRRLILKILDSGVPKIEC